MCLSYGLLCGQQQGVDVFEALELRLVYSLDDVPEERRQKRQEVLRHLHNLQT